MSRLLTLVLLAGLAPLACAAKKQPEPAPVAAPAPAPDPEAWRAQQPPPGPEPAWAPPVAKSFTLSNGVPVYLVEKPGLPLVSVRLMVTVGREANPAGKAGLAGLVANLLDEGTTKRTGTDLAAELARLGAKLTTFGGDEYAVVSLDALGGESLAPSLDLLSEVARSPRFDAKDFARVQTETLTTIQSAKAEPRDVAARVFAAQLFGAQHPYGTPAIGSEATVKAIKAADVKKFYQTWWHAGNAALVVSGAVDEATAKSLLEPRFGTWKAGKAARTDAAAPTAPMKTRVVFVEQPGAVQSVLRIGTLGPKRTAPEFTAANVAGTLVAGMFSSRINMNLREEHGWSYGAFGAFSENRDYGAFVVRTSVQADKTAPAVAEVLKELSAAASKPPAANELTLAKDSLRKSLAGNFETNANTAASFQYVPAFGLPTDFWNTWLKEMDAVDASAVEAQSKKYFDPAHMLVVVVGPRSLETTGADGAKTTVDVVGELKALGYELVEAKAQ